MDPVDGTGELGNVGFQSNIDTVVALEDFSART
jgi:hypothetical protein